MQPTSVIDVGTPAGANRRLAGDFGAGLVTLDADRAPGAATGGSAAPAEGNASLRVGYRRQSTVEHGAFGHAGARIMQTAPDTRSVSTRVETARCIDEGVVEPLEGAWVELDLLRRELDEGENRKVANRLDTIASCIQEATENALAASSNCRPRLLDRLGIAWAVEWRLGEVAARSGVEWSFEDRSSGHDGLDCSQKTALYDAADMLVGELIVRSRHIRVVLDANEHYWLLVVSASGGGALRSTAVRRGALLLSERLQPFEGKVESVVSDDAGITYYVILPTKTEDLRYR